MMLLFMPTAWTVILFIAQVSFASLWTCRMAKLVMRNSFPWCEREQIGGRHLDTIQGSCSTAWALDYLEMVLLILPTMREDKGTPVESCLLHTRSTFSEVTVRVCSHSWLYLVWGWSAHFSCSEGLTWGDRFVIYVASRCDHTWCAHTQHRASSGVTCLL